MRVVSRAIWEYEKKYGEIQISTKGVGLPD